MNTRVFLLIPAFAAVVSASILSAGCVRHGYGTGDEVNFVSPDTASLTDLTRTTGNMVRKLCGSEAFLAKYKEVRAGLADGGLPAIQIGNFDNLVAASYSREDVRQYTPKLEICRAKVRESLQDSGLFRIVDDAGSYGSDAEWLNEGLAADVDTGYVQPRNLQAAGTYTPADFWMHGSLQRQKDGDRWYYIFEMRLYDLSTREFWTSTQIFDKF